MTDEELFKAWKSEQYKDQSTEEKMEFVEHLHTFPKYFEEAFLAGLKAGRPQWHDLRKDPNDLPKEGKQYLCLIKSWVGGEKVYACLIYNTQYHSWQESYGDVIAWCELPTFDKE